MLINFWYPMALSTELGDEPLRIRTLGHFFALFRTADGAAHCLADTCPHRGGSLSGGKVVSDSIQCAYHGWRFGRTGRCNHIPTIDDQQGIPARARVDQYPVVERYGVIFAFLGDLPEDERPPITEIREWGRVGWSVTSMTYNWQASYERVIENGLDATHTEFVHPSAGLQGDFKPGSGLTSKLVELEWGSAFRTNAPKVDIEHGHQGANHQWTFLAFKMGDQTGHFNFYSFVQPVDDTSVRRYLFHARDFQLGEKVDKTMVETTLGFELEDRNVIERMQPRYSPRSSGSELLLAEDEIMLRYRQHLIAWEKRGWKIDVAAIAADAGHTAFAIPSPQRRESANWLRKAVPLVAIADDS